MCLGSQGLQENRLPWSRDPLGISAHGTENQTSSFLKNVTNESILERSSLQEERNGDPNAELLWLLWLITRTFLCQRGQGLGEERKHRSGGGIRKGRGGRN